MDSPKPYSPRLLGPIVNGRMTTRCGRRLHGAMPGHGMEEAVGTSAHGRYDAFAVCPRQCASTSKTLLQNPLRLRDWMLHTKSLLFVLENHVRTN